MTTVLEPTTAPSLDPDLLERCRRRAAPSDRNNAFFSDDFAELRDLGYLRAALPVEAGGWGWDLHTLAIEQRRLARFAPATALALSMHHYWVGTATDLARLGDDTLLWVLDDVAAGHVFASGHAEAGNDIPVVLSTTAAHPVGDGAYRLHGRKLFGSLSPVWTRLGLHALDATDPEAPAIVHGFVDRDSPGLRIVETWNTVGMRATQSHDTVLDGCPLPAGRVARIVPAGDPSDPFLAVMQLWALTLIANVYAGIAQRAVELAVEAVGKRTSVAIERTSLKFHPLLQHRAAEMYLELDAVVAVLDRLAADWVGGVDHGAGWGPKVLSAKWRAAEGARRIVDHALDLTGGASLFVGQELERLARDIRCAGFHPGSDAFTHEIIGKAVLGVPADGSRW